MSYGIISVMNVDTHFHIFYKKDVNEAHSRYSIDYDATIDDWQKESEKQQIKGGVIIQPSFLGFDNSLLLQAIKQSPELLRGVASIEADASKETLAEIKGQGIAGIRLNLVGESNPIAKIETSLNLIAHLQALDMHLQIHHDDGLLNQLLLTIPKGVKIVVDHFGRPKNNSEFHENTDGIIKHQGNLWVKLSAQYRTPEINHKMLFEYWLKQIGASRLLWGSDWPHTNFEASESYEDQMNNFLELVDDSSIRNQILCDNPLKLYW